jgi:hypothetical protein
MYAMPVKQMLDPLKTKTKLQHNPALRAAEEVMTALNG